MIRRLVAIVTLTIVGTILVLMCATLCSGQDPYEEYILDNFTPFIDSIYNFDDDNQQCFDALLGYETATHTGTPLLPTVINDSVGTSIYLYGNQQILGPVSCLNLPGADGVCGTIDDKPIDFTILLWARADDSFGVGGLWRKGTGAAADIINNGGFSFTIEMVLYNPQLQESTIVSVTPAGYNPEQRHLYAFTYSSATNTASVYVDAVSSSETLTVDWYQTYAEWVLGDIFTVDAFPASFDGFAALVGYAMSASEIAEARMCGNDGERFIRGDANSDGIVSIADVPVIYNQTGPCREAMDANSSGTLNIVDMVYLLTYLFNSGPAPAAPFGGCGHPDGVADTLTCLEHTCD